MTVQQASLATGTIAVPAGWLDIFAGKRGLHHENAGKGLLVSEMTPGTQPRAELFRTGPRGLRRHITASILILVKL